MGIGLANIVYWSTAAVAPAPAFTGLLDAYPGATFAYSLRLLKSDYSGNAVRVRRASDNTEQDIGFANNELDTASLETFCSGTDGFVTTWYDQSGNAANVANAAASYQPQIVSSGTSLGYVKTFDMQKLFAQGILEWSNGIDYSVFGVMKNTGNNLFISGLGGGYAAISNNNQPSRVGASYFTEGNRYKNGSLIGATWGDMHNATTSFAAMSLYVTCNLNIYGSLGGYVRSYNNSQLKEYIVYPNQTISRTGVETNIIDHYNF
jgi:hypothetical protein